MNKSMKLTTALSLSALLASAAPAFAFRGQPNARPLQQRQNKQQRFRGMDRNGDGVITRDEWRGNDHSFRKHDRNRDGILSGDELRGNDDDQGDDHDWNKARKHHEDRDDQDDD